MEKGRKLNLFGFIDQTVAILDEKRDLLEIFTDDLYKYFRSLLEEFEFFVNINHRVKSVESLKEKMIRTDSYNENLNPEEYLFSLSDLIGLRIECRFIEDEAKIYKRLSKIFSIDCGNGYYCAPESGDILLRLGEKQPQDQKNGFKIYRIDGIIKRMNTDIKFELQIKALVNMFWSEIEHKIIYKNYTYNFSEKFYRDMLHSIKQNLEMVDKQLLLVFNQINAQDNMKKDKRMANILSRSINETFSYRIMKSIGTSIDFRQACDIMSEYIIKINRLTTDESYNLLIVDKLSRFNDIVQCKLNVEDEISFERELIFTDKYEKMIGEHVLANLNINFKLHLFFIILFEVEVGNNAEDFEGFISFFTERAFQGIHNEHWQHRDILNEGEKAIVEEDIKLAIISYFSNHMDIALFNSIFLKKLGKKVETMLLHIKSFEQWEDTKAEQLNEFLAGLNELV